MNLDDCVLWQVVLVRAAVQYSTVQYSKDWM